MAKKVQDHTITIGVDEAGRGPWAGPVVACAYVFMPTCDRVGLLPHLADSKKLSPKRRTNSWTLLHELADRGDMLWGK